MKTTCLLLQCSNGSRFHFGRTGIDTTSILLHSDTFFSAIANAYELVFGSAEPFIRHIQQGKLLFSSALPCLLNSQTNNYIFFFPIPCISFSQASDIRQRKLIKKRRFISTSVLTDIIQEPLTLSTDASTYSSPVDILSYPVIDSTFVYHSSELASDLITSPFLSVQTLPKVQVHTLLGTGNLYHETFVHLTDIIVNNQHAISGHYYVLIEHDLSEDDWKKFLTVLSVAADEGFGGERSTGAGYFNSVLIINPPLLPLVQNPSLYMTLSLTAPSKSTELSAFTSYSTIIRGGGIIKAATEPSGKSQRVRMIEEGGVIDSKVQGHLVDISPSPNPLPHPIYRNGISFSIPIQ